MQLTRDILTLKPYIFQIAYNMLASVHEAEDVVQDVFEKWLTASDVANPKAYLARMAVNRCIKRLDELKKERETYKGTWLPEPYITTEPDPLPTIEYGLLFLLERLNPIERAVFVLRESLADDYAHIAAVTGLTADNCRQVLHRSHEKLGRTATYKPDASAIRSLTEAFLLALNTQDRSALETILKTDIELYSDGGGKRSAALRPLLGMVKVVKFLLGIMALPENTTGDMVYQPVYVNGLPAALIIRTGTGQADTIQYVEAEGTQITRLLSMRNPDKLVVRKTISGTYGM